MSFSLNRVELIGRLGQDPDTRFTAGGQAITRLSLATDRPARPGTQAETDWHQVICWDKLAELAGQYLAKGRLVFVAGRLGYRSWEGKNGQQRRAAEVTATELILLDRRPAPEPPEDAAAVESSVAEGSDPDDELPF
ncbi:MAG: single-stranded DNA-binding protein [Chloroflexi bacterium]|nr:single-stranded DNA-binding protein [Chloroflexota bacterium]